MRDTCAFRPNPFRATRHWSIIASVLIAVLLTGCMESTPPGSVQGSLVGIGTDSQQGSIGAWAKSWRSEFERASIAFSPDGAEVGKTALFNGLAYFAAGDAPLTPVELGVSQSACGIDGPISIPVAVVPVGVVFNLDQTTDLRLDADVLIDIFNGLLTQWDDPRIAALNPGTALSPIDIVPILGKEPSDVTHAVNDYLAAEAPGHWATGNGREWPKSVNSTEDGTATDLAHKVDQTKGSIAVLDMGIIGSRFSVAQLKFGGDFQPFSSNSAISAIRNGTTVETGPRVVEQSLDGSRGYALAIVENQYFCSRYANEATAALVRSWAEAVLSTQGQKDAVIFSSALAPNEKTTTAALALVGTISGDKK